jgi:hypothetical protein
MGLLFEELHTRSACDVASSFFQAKKSSTMGHVAQLGMAISLVVDFCQARRKRSMYTK